MDYRPVHRVTVHTLRIELRRKVRAKQYGRTPEENRRQLQADPAITDTLPCTMPPRGNGCFDPMGDTLRPWHTARSVRILWVPRCQAGMQSRETRTPLNRRKHSIHHVSRVAKPSQIPIHRVQCICLLSSRCLPWRE